jgi:hypothetical protein
MSAKMRRSVERCPACLGIILSSGLSNALKSSTKLGKRPRKVSSKLE